MAIFSGAVLGVPFKEEATDSLDLLRKLFPNGEEEDPCHRLRMWTLCEEYFWSDVYLRVESKLFFDGFVELIGVDKNQINTIIRRDGEISPRYERFRADAELRTPEISFQQARSKMRLLEWSCPSPRDCGSDHLEESKNED